MIAPRFAYVLFGLKYQGALAEILTDPGDLSDDRPEDTECDRRDYCGSDKKTYAVDDSRTGDMCHCGLFFDTRIQRDQLPDDLVVLLLYAHLVIISPENKK